MLIPCLTTSNPSIVTLGVNASLLMIATISPPTINFIITCSEFNVSNTLSTTGPDCVPSLNCGPTRIQVDPDHKYSCWLAVSTHKSPIVAVVGWLGLRSTLPAATHLVPS